MMQVAYEVCRGNAKYPGEVKFSNFRLPFKVPGRQEALPANMTTKTATMYSQAQWVGRMTMPIQRRRLRPEEVE
jgi:hypothetical protein